MNIAGIRTRYGQPEPWKATAKIIGRTKHSRGIDPAVSKRKRNDGRAPDTSKEVLAKPVRRRRQRNDGRPPDTKKALKLQKISTKKKRTKAKRSPSPDSPSSPDSSDSNGTFINSKSGDSDLGDSDDTELPQRIVPKAPKQLELAPQSYRWSKNSCWLDTSLELLYIALSNGGLQEFSALCVDLPKNSAILTLHTALIARHDLVHDQSIQDSNVIAQRLTAQREKLRSELRKRKLIQGLNTYESLWVGVR